ncbi:MAG: nuclear transport factor 2 family protein [Deltaproteobacteria bacterium]|nr:nuclear transport factor 2 family protein [Deltaproteobacteria bacterium]
MTTETTPGTTIDTSSERSAQQVVEAFISALERLDLDAAAALVADDIRWVNVPWKTSINKNGFNKVLGAMFKEATRFEVRYSDIHERGDGVVYTDRVDIFEGGGLRMNLPVQGEFRVKDGLVNEWVDRFSWATLIGEMGRSLPAILKHRLGR